MSFHQEHFENIIKRFEFFTSGIEKSNLNSKDENGIPNQLPSYLDWDFDSIDLIDTLEEFGELCILNDAIHHNLSFDQNFLSNLELLIDKRIENEDVDSEYDIYDIDFDIIENFTQTEFFLFAASGNSLVMVYLWLIKTLNQWCIFAGGEKRLESAIKKNKNSARPKSEFELRVIFLDEHLIKKNSISILDKIEQDGFLSLINDNVRSIRNSYSHGEWEEIRKQTENIQIKEVIRRVSHFMFFLCTSFETSKKLG